MKTPSPEVFLGWARCAAAEGMEVMPLYVSQSAHEDCKDVETTWNSLLEIEKKRKDLMKRWSNSLQWQSDETELFNRAMYFASNLAWGDVQR